MRVRTYIQVWLRVHACFCVFALTNEPVHCGMIVVLLSKAYKAWICMDKSV